MQLALSFNTTADSVPHQVTADVSVYDSDSATLLVDCQKGKPQKTAPVFAQEGITLTMASEVKMADLPTIDNQYRMISIVFTSYPDQDSGVIAIVAHQRYRNLRLTRYETTLSIFFFIAAAINAFFCLKKVWAESDVGEVKRIVAAGSLLLILFNVPYKYSLTTNKLTAIWDTFVNCSTMCFMLTLNLVVTHALTANTSLSKKQFYLPKLLIAFALFVTMSVWQYANYTNFLRYFKNDFKEDP